MTRKIIIALSCAGVLVPAFAMAQVSATASTTAVTDLQTTLHFGDKGDLVKILQALLASDPTVFPEGTITGNFGPLTQKAVKRFQKKNGIIQVGNVGPRTLQKLNEKFADLSLAFEASSTTDMDAHEANNGSNRNGHHEGRHLCVPPGLMIAPGWLTQNGESKLPPCKGMRGGMGTSTMSTTTWRGHGHEIDHRGGTSTFERRMGSSTRDRHENDGDDRTTMCSNPWSTASSSIRWPKGIPCPTSSSTPPFMRQMDDIMRHGRIGGDHPSCPAPMPNATGTPPCPPPPHPMDTSTQNGKHHEGGGLSH